MATPNSNTDTYLAHARIGLAGGHKGLKNRIIVKRADCTAAQLYKTPASGAKVNSKDDFLIEWDTSCLDTKKIDIHVFNPLAATPNVYTWYNVDYTTGSFKEELKPRWWNATASADLYLTLAVPEEPLFMFPVGPVFTATYEAPSSGPTPANADITKPADSYEVVGGSDDKGISKGGIAAAVLVPIIVIAALIAAAFIKLSRARQTREREQAKVDIDRRMSRISSDWKSITPSGASAAIRSSMAVPGDRASSFSFGTAIPRPLSSIAVEGGQAGIGTRGMQWSAADATGSHDSVATDATGSPQMSQLRPGVRASAFEERKSRVVSFADQPRPSMESRKTVRSRAFHEGFVPPVPTRQDSGELSPTQTQGPFTLTSEDIRARINGSEGAPRPSVDEMMPALSMMRQGGDGQFANENLITSPMPTPPTPTYNATSGQIERSPIMGLMPMQPMPANVMSPDELLRAYAESKARGGGAASPPPVATPVNANGMRILYTPQQESSPYRQSMAANTIHSDYSHYTGEHGHEDPYGGTSAH